MRRSLACLVLGVPALAWAGGPLEAGGEVSGGGGSDHADETLLDARPEQKDEPQGIINGADATTEQYPMAGGMMMDAFIDSPFGSGDIRTFVCSSTLIAPDVVLLAAHCLDEAAFTGGFGGSVDINDIGWSRQADLTSMDGSNPNAAWPEDTVFASGWVKHPDFDIQTMGMGLSENFDIALLFLDTPVLDVPYAYLPTVEEAEQIAEGLDVTVVGWGQQSATSGFQAPPAGTFAIKQIGTSYLAEVAPYEMQVGAVEDDVRKCHGDSGGPTFLDLDVPTETKTRLIGVTSHAYDQSDCNETGGVDTRVDHYLDWIDAEMAAACADGTRVWCDEPGIIAVPKREKGGACGCVVAPAPAVGGFWGLGLLALAGLRRRRA